MIIIGACENHERRVMNPKICDKNMYNYEKDVLTDQENVVLQEIGMNNDCN